MVELPHGPFYFGDYLYPQLDTYLGAAIDSLLNQDYAHYEVIVVDNASTDTTKAVVEARLPHERLSYIYETTLGLSVAQIGRAHV